MKKSLKNDRNFDAFSSLFENPVGKRRFFMTFVRDPRVKECKRSSQEAALTIFYRGSRTRVIKNLRFPTGYRRAAILIV